MARNTNERISYKNNFIIAKGTFIFTNYIQPIASNTNPKVSNQYTPTQINIYIIINSSNVQFIKQFHLFNMIVKNVFSLDCFIHIKWGPIYYIYINHWI